MKRFLQFFTKRKNRDIISIVSVLLAVLLAVGAVLLDEQLGAAATPWLYAMQLVCFAAIIAAILMTVANLWIGIGKKIDKRKMR